MSINTIAAQKKVLRMAMITWLKILTAKQIKFRSKLISAQLSRQVNPLAYSKILVYKPLSYEPQLSELFHNWYQINPKLSIYFPFNKKVAIRLMDSEIEASPAEITEIELIIIPGLAFTHNRMRLGHGASWYDKLLTHCPTARTIGVAFKEQIINKLPQGKHDIPLGEIVVG